MALHSFEFTVLLVTSVFISLSISVTVRTDTVEIIPSQKLELSLMDQDSRRRHFVSQPQTVATVAPLVLETHRVIPNQLFSLAPGYKTERPVVQPAYTPTYAPTYTATYAPPYTPVHDLQILTSVVKANPVVTALLLSTLLGRQHVGQNSPEQPGADPFLALLLSHYGRYIPRPGHYDGLYGYNAANNIHNTKPFGSYKIYDDSILRH